MKGITQYIIDIEGTIGVPEKMQFKRHEHKFSTYEKVREAIAVATWVESDEIIVNIQSTGGAVNDALKIREALDGCQLTVTTRCYGYVASAATIIAQAASLGKREISETALYLIHNAVPDNDLVDTIDGVTLAEVDEHIADIFAMRSGRSTSEISALMAENNGNGRWLSPEEAVAAGLADTIIKKAKGE